jgi:prophage antirepressor-like protein
MEEQSITVFKNETIGEIKGFIKDGEPWFLAGNVCNCLGLKNSRDTLKQIVDRHEKYGNKVVGISYILLDTKGGKQKVSIISEPILYELIFRSTKKKAFEFQQWVFEDVLPALRKHGEYRMETKLFTKDLHENIKQNICDKTENESVKKFAYSNFHGMINKSIGLPEKNNRGNLSDEQLEKIAHRENLVSALISEGKNYSEIKEIVKAL